ncbi:hypothetical protein [Candidatus Nesciobacter abundans]|uniref:Glutathione S-transferase n=1 Tax=Candidatus Nesciobacter abundans TaxID=2601668 RepID=A0A5C0UHK7_9PROT|nr:hypothetical protein [Candidatus Nesciobacter abundans]QEK39181.1 hypothetical protein FZC36_01920 [Candidatus Nesciobacter abundans]
MKIYGSVFCPFRRYLEIILQEQKVEFTVSESPEDVFFPYIKENGKTYIGLLSTDEVINKIDKNDKPWFFWIITDFFPSLKLIIKQRFFNEFNTNHSSQILEYSKRDMNDFLIKLESIFSDQNWIGKYGPSSSDFLFSSIISYLDYLNEIKWTKYENIKIWYSSIKCRPSFDKVLSYRLPGIKPSPQYKIIDF